MARRPHRKQILVAVVPASRVRDFVIYEIIVSTVIYWGVKQEGGNEWTAFGASALVPAVFRKLASSLGFARKPLVAPLSSLWKA